MTKQITQTFISVMLVLLSATLLANETALIGCNADDDWPPYFYRQRENDKPTKKLLGYDIDVFHAIFTKNNIPFTIELLPWKRCLAQLEEGSIDFSFSMIKSTEREAIYLFSEPYYQLTPTFVYNKSYFSVPIQVSNAAALLPFGSVCGSLGYVYTNFGISDNNVKTTRIQNDTELLHRVERGACAFGLIRYETVAGFSLINQLLLKDPLKVQTFKEVKNEDFYVAFSRANPKLEAIRDLFNREVQKMKDSGELKKLLHQYIPENLN